MPGLPGGFERLPEAGEVTAAGRPVLLIASNFPPVRGGSAMVYASLARYAGGRIVVLAPQISYIDGLPLIGWREHDRHAPYRVVRLKLVRSPIRRADLGLALRSAAVLHDGFVRLRLFGTVMRLVVGAGVRTVCVGELLANSWLLRLLRWIPGLRCIAYVHGEEVTTVDAYDPGHARSRRALLASDVVVVVSRFTQDAVEALMATGGTRRVRLIENGVDINRFSPGPKSASLLDLYGLHGRFVFVSVSRLVEKKGIDNAIRAFARMAAADTTLRFLVIGSGPFEAGLHAIAEECGMSDAVIFAGSVPEDELVEHYRLGDVFVMPNRELADGDTEGFGLVFLEANACGLPVVAGRDGGSTDAVQDGVNGLVVDGGSVEEIAAAFTRLHADAALRARLAKGGSEVSRKAGWAMKTALFLSATDGA